MLVDEDPLHPGAELPSVAAALPHESVDEHVGTRVIARRGWRALSVDVPIVPGSVVEGPIVPVVLPRRRVGEGRGDETVPRGWQVAVGGPVGVRTPAEGESIRARRRPSLVILVEQIAPPFDDERPASSRRAPNRGGGARGGCRAPRASPRGEGVRPPYIPIPPGSPSDAASPPRRSRDGCAATIASVVSMSAATDAAFCRATRTTLVGSMIPASTSCP